MFENVREDIRLQLPPYGPLKAFGYLLFKQELHAVLIYRFGYWATHRCRVPVLRKLLSVTYFFLSKVSEMIFGVWIYAESEIGPGLKVEHSGGIILGPGRMGRGCRVSSQVVVGHIGGFRGGGLPIIGDNVYLGAGAKVLGDVKIGDEAIIGANAVVISDVPAGALAVGVPAQIKMRKKSERKNTGAGQGVSDNP